MRNLSFNELACTVKPLSREQHLRQCFVSNDGLHGKDL